MFLRRCRRFIFSCGVTGGVICDQIVWFVGKLPGDQRIIRPKRIIERLQRIFYFVGVLIAKMITEHPKNDGRIFIINVVYSVNCFLQRCHFICSAITGGNASDKIIQTVSTANNRTVRVLS